MKLSALKKKTRTELIEYAQSTKEKITDKRRQYVMGEITDNQELKKLKRELAQTLTLINQSQEAKQ